MPAPVLKPIARFGVPLSPRIYAPIPAAPANVPPADARKPTALLRGGGMLGRWPGRSPVCYAPVLPPSVVTTGGIGPAGAATFVLDMLPGTRTTFSWATDVISSWNGFEQRVSLLGAPRQRYVGAAYLVDADDRTIRAQLIAAAAQGQAFLLGLPFEELSVSGAASGVVVPVNSTLSCDWAFAGQRVVIRSRDGASAGSAVVVSTTLQSITLDTDLSAIAKLGAKIMPATAVYLDPQQGIVRYPVNAGQWNISAKAALFGFAGRDQMGMGATVTTFNGLPVWDRGTMFAGSPPNDSILTHGEVIDYGGLLASHGVAAVSDWGRQINYRSSSPAEWQWWKAFISGVRGRQLVFLLPTGRVDIVFKQKTSDQQIVVYGTPTAGAGDPRSIWSGSLAHSNIAITCTDGSVVIADVAAFVDNGDGTATIQFALGTLGGRTPVAISWAEQCRFESDDFEATWDGSIFSVSPMARTVQR